MAIRVVPDIGAPATVIAVDLMTESFAPGFSEPASYLMTGLGYLAGMTRFGGDYLKNIGVASAPMSARRLFERVRGTSVPITGRMASRVSRFPAALVDTEFRGARLV